MSSYKATPKTENHKHKIRCALLARLHLDTHFVYTIPWNDAPLLFKCSPKILIYAAHGRGVYNCSRLFRMLAHAELFGIFNLFTLVLEEFDYTARVQHALVAVERK